MNISLSFPDWYIFICVALGILYAFVFYRKDRLLEEVRRFWRWLLFGFRLITVTFLALLLLEPIMESVSTKLEKPIVVLAHDNSESLLLGKDSSYISGKYKDELVKLEKKLSEKFEVQSYTFGGNVIEGLNLDFKEKTTNISDFFSQVYTRFYNRNLGAIVIASDGIYNHGTDPVYVADKIKNTPIYSIALGDTSAQKDIILTDVAHNRLAYLGNDFPVEIALRARGFSDKQTTVSILKDGKIIRSETVQFGKEDFFSVVPFKIEAKNTGIQKYTVVIEPLTGELTTSNNYREIYIDVLDSKQKILMLAGAPNPDISALKMAIERNKNYIVEVSLVEDFEGEPSDFSLIIAHQVPFNSDVSNTHATISSSGTPMLYILGAQTRFAEFNSKKMGLKIVDARGLTNAQVLVNKSFPLFTIDENFKREIEKFPPLTLPFASEYQSSNSSEILFYQKIGNAKTKFPLLLFNKVRDNKYGFILGEGIWRWRMADYQENRTHEQFDKFIGKIITYLASKEDKSFFRVYSSTDYREDQDVTLDAELYNRSYELVNDVDAHLSMINEAGEEFDFSFTPTSDAYRLNCNQLPKGEYQYTARVKRQDEVFEQEGQFTVSELKVEMTNATANHELLYNLAEKSNGRMYYADQLKQLQKEILAKKEIVDVSYSEKKLTDLINWDWICFILIGLLGLEWFMRKYKGAY